MQKTIVLGGGLNINAAVAQALYDGWQNCHVRLCWDTGDVLGFIPENARYIEFVK